MSLSIAPLAENCDALKYWGSVFGLATVDVRDVPKHSFAGRKLRCFEMLEHYVWPIRRSILNVYEGSWMFREVVLRTGFTDCYRVRFQGIS